MQVNDRLFEIRSAMGAAAIDAYIVPSTDAHLSEYVADYWKFREWLTGFTGSVGTLVVTEDLAALWTDSRYFLQAEEQLKGTGIDLIKMGTTGAPSIEQWIMNQINPGSTVGLDGRLFSVDEIRQYLREFKKANILVDSHKTLIDEIWDARPPVLGETIFELSKKITGFERIQKLNKLRGYMESANVTHYITGALDEIAWILNLRGNDIDYNPVFHAYLVIDEENANLFTDPHKIKASIGKALFADDTKTSLYEDFYEHLKDLFTSKSHVYYDPKRTNGATIAALPSNVEKTEGPSIISRLKAIKNQPEIASIDKTMLKDGVAMVGFLHWLDNTIGKETLTETSIAKKCKWFRSQQEGFWGESFNTIAGYGKNGAIVHYSATPSSAAVLQQEGFLLFDSGGQYMEGTTDITRTISLGKLTEQQMIDYTLVLKSHIALAMTIFPEGTKGIQLDAIARQQMWNQTRNYGHGTGHGVGLFLNVHEGPQSISPKDNPYSIEVGMLNSNEPGIYRPNEYGIRIENLIITETHLINDFGVFLKFRTVTLCPIDTKPIILSMLTESEKNWLNAYHQNVCEKLLPLLPEETKQWLIERTQNI